MIDASFETPTPRTRGQKELREIQLAALDEGVQAALRCWRLDAMTPYLDLLVDLVRADMADLQAASELELGPLLDAETAAMLATFTNARASHATEALEHIGDATMALVSRLGVEDRVRELVEAEIDDCIDALAVRLIGATLDELERRDELAEAGAAPPIAEPENEATAPRSIFWLPPAMRRAISLGVGRRLQTFNWLVSVLEENSGRPWHDAWAALDAAIAPGQEHVLDDGNTFMPALEQAAAALGVQVVALRLHGGAVQ